MSKEKDQKKGETFNALDERFQLQPQHDDNHIFPEEYEMITEMRRKKPELEKESDKFLCVFLFSRRHDVEDTLELLEKYMKKRKEFGFDVNPPNVKEEALKKHIETGVILKQKGSVDKHDRLLNYIFVAKDRPKERQMNVLYAYGFWETTYQIQTETLRSWRNGSVLVVDFKDFSLFNVDFGPKTIEYSKALSGVFPKRIRKVYLMNGGWLLKLISEGAKLVLSKKLSDRVETVHQDALKQLIPDEWLLRDYGGSSDYTVNTWVDNVIKEQEKEDKEHQRKIYERENSLGKNLGVSV